MKMLMVFFSLVAFALSLFFFFFYRDVIPLFSAEVSSEVLIAEIQKVIWMTVGISVFLAVCVSVWVARQLTRPLEKVSLAANKISLGQSARKIRVWQKDEVGDLVSSFNRMSKQIRRRMRQETENKLRLEAVLLSMSEGVMAVDSKGDIILMNTALRSLLDVPADTIARRPLEVIHNLAIQELVDQTLLRSGGVESKEIDVLSLDRKTVLVHAAPVVRKGSTQGAVLVFHDVTELRHLEQIRREFVANVSHELRTPLASIQGYTETLLEGALDDKENSQKMSGLN